MQMDSPHPDPVVVRLVEEDFFRLMFETEGV